MQPSAYWHIHRLAHLLMPISRPFARANRAVWSFTIFTYLLAAALLYYQTEDATLLYVIGTWLIFSVALTMTVRFFVNYKIIEAKKGKIFIRKTYLKTEKVFLISEIKDWQEQIIKTFNTEYKLLTIRFEKGFLEISNQEYDNYQKLKEYITQNAASQKKK